MSDDFQQRGGSPWGSPPGGGGGNGSGRGPTPPDIDGIIREIQDKIKKALSSSGLGVNLTSMGTYNADAIKQLKKPNLIVANYVGEDGKKIDITVIYVFDKTLNGVMRFDGYMNRSPYKFEVSRKNAKSLIAFDDKMNAYMVPNDMFRKLIQNKKAVFVLQPFKKATSKDELRNQMEV